MLSGKAQVCVGERESVCVARENQRRNKGGGEKETKKKGSEGNEEEGECPSSVSFPDLASRETVFLFNFRIPISSPSSPLTLLPASRPALLFHPFPSIFSFCFSSVSFPRPFFFLPFWLCRFSFCSLSSLIPISLPSSAMTLLPASRPSSRLFGFRWWWRMNHTI